MQNNFIKYCFLFFTPLIIGYALLEYLTLEIPSSFKANKTAINLKQEKFETLILGSSQMMVGINAEWIDSPTLNLATGSQHHNTDFKLIKSLSPKFKNLKTVVLEVSYSHFELPHNGMKFWKNPLYLKFYNVNMYERQTYFKDKLVFLKNPSLFLNDVYDYYFKNNLSYSINDYGFNTINYNDYFKELNYNENEISQITKLDINTKENLDLFNNNTKLFFEILDYLEDKKIHIIICKVPMYKTFLNQRNENILKRRDSILNVVLKKYKGVEILDLEEDTINFKVTDYKNDSHLNPDGAKIFTQKLNEVINNINY